MDRTEAAISMSLTFCHCIIASTAPSSCRPSHRTMATSVVATAAAIAHLRLSASSLSCCKEAWHELWEEDKCALRAA
jgi:hypothetical protein